MPIDLGKDGISKSDEFLEKFQNFCTRPERPKGVKDVIKQARRAATRVVKAVRLFR